MTKLFEKTIHQQRRSSLGIKEMRVPTPTSNTIGPRQSSFYVSRTGEGGLWICREIEMGFPQAVFHVKRDTPGTACLTRRIRSQDRGH